MLRLALLLALLATPAAAQTVTEAQVRDLAARQTQAWNAGDLDAYFRLFSPNAVFRDQARGSDGKLHPYGQATAAQARAQARRMQGTAKVSEEARVLNVAVVRRGAAAVLEVVTRIEAQGRVRTVCAQRLLTAAVLDGRLQGLSRTDTIVRCPRQGASAAAARG